MNEKKTRSVSFCLDGDCRFNIRSNLYQIRGQLGGDQLHLLSGRLQLWKPSRVLLRLRHLATLLGQPILLQNLVGTFLGSFIVSASNHVKEISTSRWIYGDNYCTILPRQFFNSASSLRFTGAPDDMHFDTVNFYAGEQVAVVNHQDNDMWP